MRDGFENRLFSRFMFWSTRVNSSCRIGSSSLSAAIRAFSQTFRSLSSILRRVLRMTSVGLAYRWLGNCWIHHPLYPFPKADGPLEYFFQLNACLRSRIYPARLTSCMSRMDPQIRPRLLKHLTSQISRISEQQTEALRNAAFVGMTEEDVREYQYRGRKLAELVNELAVLTSPKMP